MNNQKLFPKDFVVAGNKAQLNSEIAQELSCDEVKQLLIRMKNKADISSVELNSLILHLSSCSQTHLEE